MSAVSDKPVEVKEHFGWHGTYAWRVEVTWTGESSFLLRGTANDERGALACAMSRLAKTYPDSPAAMAHPPDRVLIEIDDG